MRDVATRKETPLTSDGVNVYAANDGASLMKFNPSLGLLATVGSLSVLLASLSILPAFLRLVEHTYSREPALRPYFSLGWWLSAAIRKKAHEKAALDLDR